MQTKQLNISMLRAECQKDNKLRHLFELYSDRGRGRQSCTVPRIRRIMKESGTDLTRDEAIQIMKVWQQAGCGRYVSGQRDQDNRFLWAWDIPSLAKRVTATAAPENVTGALVAPAPKPRLRLPLTPGEIVPGGDKIPLGRQGASVKIRFDGFEIELPTNMTAEERSEAQKFISSLKGLT